MKQIIALLMGGGLQLVSVGMTLQEFEVKSAEALEKSGILRSATFSSQVEAAASSASVRLRVDANMMKSIIFHQKFFDTADGRFLQAECLAASNAVAEASSLANDWRYWCANFLYAGSRASLDAYGQSYCILTNGIRGMETSSLTGDTNRLCAAILRKSEMDGLNLQQAFQAMAGMSAAEQGLRMEALRHARRLPTKFRTILEEFIAAKCPVQE